MAVGSELGRLRRGANLTGREVQQATGISATRLSKMESGRAAFPPADLDALLRVYQVGPQDQERIRADAARADDPDRRWWDSHRDVMGPHLRTHVALEAASSLICTIEPGIIPGLLQTEEYARSICKMHLPKFSEEEIERRVQLRLTRQYHFATAPEPKKIWAVIDQGALTRHTGGKEVMQKQIRHLAELTSNPRYSLKVALAADGGVPHIFGSLTIFQFDDSRLPETAYLESEVGASFVNDRQAVETYRMRFSAFSQKSLNRESTQRFLRDLAEHYS